MAGNTKDKTKISTRLLVLKTNLVGLNYGA